jgi:hypothetical protein
MMTQVVLLVLVVALVGVVVAFLLRRRFLLSGLGAVTMWLRPPDSRWSVGVAWYGGDTLLWYRALSLAVRPNQRLCRSELAIESRRIVGQEEPALAPGSVVLRCRTGAGPRELAMDPSTVTGFLSWVESAPPVR